MRQTSAYKKKEKKKRLSQFNSLETQFFEHFFFYYSLHVQHGLLNTLRCDNKHKCIKSSVST